ncbi:MAG: ThiF family adenylyltransferase [Bacteroidetes bacterium]|nr:ThiF family adenylyltransferase [Bacteroidota bacterium]
MNDSKYTAIISHLFPGDNLEAVAILLCNQGSGKLYQRLIVSDIIYPSGSLSDRKQDFISWPVEDFFTPQRISEIDQNGQSIIIIHSHPSGCTEFSEVDDHNDQRLFSSICNWFDDGRLNGSAIALPDGRITARTVDVQGTFNQMPAVSVVGENICIWKLNQDHQQAEYRDHLSQIFGQGTLNLLQSLRVGVIGCSGTGSILIELLVRNCVGELVIVDDDLIEEKNLNRIINSTVDDAKSQRSKVSSIARAIKNIGTGTKVDTYCGLTDCPDVKDALIDCDVIFGCVDTAFGRYHLDCIASAYLIPYFDTGVHLEADGNGCITVADAVTHYTYPEGGSLLSRGAYTMSQVTAENWKRLDPEYYDQQLENGYLTSVGEQQPAVISLNMQAACMTFNDFMARVHHFRIDSNGQFSTQRFRLVHGCYENTMDDQGPHPLLERYMGSGDKSLLVNNNTRYGN